jgi:von Willebrand factor type A domain
MKERIMIREEDQESSADKERSSGESSAQEARAGHEEAVEFVGRHRDFFEHYARGEVNVKPAPAGLDTFAFDLQSNDIYVNSRFYRERGFSDEKTTFATLHEIEHFKEKAQVLAERGGQRTFERYVNRIKSSRAYGLMDNCVADIRENRAVISRTNQSFADIESSLYREDLFKETDFRSQPKHIQLAQALLRESRVPGEACEVSPEVREKLDALRAIASKDGTKLLDAMTDPSTPMSMRLKLQDRYIWPAVDELLKKDMEDEKKKQQQKQDQQGQGQSGEQSKDQGQGKEGQGEESQKQQKKSWFGKGKKDKNKKEAPSGASKGDKGETPSDPNEVFKGAYEDAEKKVMNAVPIEDVEKALKDWKEGGGDPLERADREYAAKLGVKKEELDRYRNIVKSLEDMKNPETNQSVIEELRTLIERIIARRLKPVPAPRYPMEEGEDLVEAGQLVSDVKAGNLEPKVWETAETRERPGKKFGEVEITLVCDRSGSMAQGAKLIEQRKAAVLLMEALREFAERCEEERTNVDKPLEIRSEVYSFQSSSEDATPLKKMSKELGEKERIEVATALSSVEGSTTDFIPLETIEKRIDADSRKKITDGELKKIVVVFTDGESDDPGRVRKILQKLREQGVVAIGVGITEDGKAALTTYAPDAKLAEKAEQLGKTLGELLQEHLADV